jgi:thiol-disulfide isomerase/thioredoxin
MRRLMIALSLSLFFGLGTHAHAQSKEKKSEPAEEKKAAPSPLVPNPILFLIRDKLVQTDLQLRDDQKKSIRETLDEIDGPLWLLRDVGPEDGKARGDALIAKAKSGLDGILNTTQQKRLDQIVLQSQGPEALLLPGVAQKLGLSSDQRQEVRKTIDARQDEYRQLLTQAADNKDPEKLKELEQKGVKVREAEHEQLLIILTDNQKKQWGAMLGKAIDLTHVQMSNIKAPELVSPDEWINSEPLTLTKLRGQVVALHFWTFGCINCIRNYPWYKSWHETYANQGLTVLGIHTPEGDGEKVVDSVRKKVAENEILYPIAIDGDARTWKAWGNAWWPATYLIDKKGYVRYWWYGELNWEGKEGEKFMRSKIEELLKEE